MRRANEHQETRDALDQTIDAERKTIARLVEENERLTKELEQVKLELKRERQNKFASNKQTCDDEPESTEPVSDESRPKKKRGAPVGHKGWYRPTPTEDDDARDVPAPKCCQHCQGRVIVDHKLPSTNHVQEDVVDGQ